MTVTHLWLLDTKSPQSAENNEAKHNKPNQNVQVCLEVREDTRHFMSEKDQGNMNLNGPPGRQNLYVM